MPARLPRRRVATAIIGMLAFALVLAGCSTDPSVSIDMPPQVDQTLPAETTEQLESAVTEAMAAAGASGAIVGVWAPWSGTWVAALGTQSMGGGAPVTIEDEFRIGPVTRSMTCDALYVLVGKNKVRLDDPVTKYASGFPDLSDVTLEELCDGTSGIGSYSSQLMSLWLQNPERVWNPRELVSYGAGQPRETEPGQAWRDSDAGYVLLGLALEHASGMSFADLLEEYVIDPLDLTATSLPKDAAADPSSSGPVLKGYHSTKDADGVMNCTDPMQITKLSPSIGFANSGVVSDITDLGRYAQALASGALMPAGADRFDKPMAVYAGAPSWYTTTGGAFQAGALIGQFGMVPGYLTAAFSDPETGLTVAVVLNNSAIDSGVGAYLAWELAAIASKSPAAKGETFPDGGLPFTSEQYHEAIVKSAICPLPEPEPAPAPEGE